MISDIGTIIADFAEVYVLHRRAAGSTTNGRFTPGSTSNINVAAVITPAAGRDLLRLPEGERSAATIRIISQAEMLVTPGQPDELTYRGARWVLRHLADWEPGGFYDALAQRKAEQG